jgi:hypothetical protein
MSEHYIEIKTVNRKMKLMYGDKLTGTQKAIGLRSNGLHVVIRFTDRYGRISWHCTLADGMGGCGFKMIGFSHEYQWSTVRIAVTAEQEARLFAKACEMADVPTFQEFCETNGNNTIEIFMQHAGITKCMYGPDHIKYDRWGASFGFISKLRIWRMHPEDMICNEAVANVMIVVWPDLLVVDQDYFDVKKSIGSIPGQIFIDAYEKKDPATLTPDIFEYMVRHYFSKEQK